MKNALLVVVVAACSSGDAKPSPETTAKPAETAAPPKAKRTYPAEYQPAIAVIEKVAAGQDADVYPPGETMVLFDYVSGKIEKPLCMFDSDAREQMRAAISADAPRIQQALASGTLECDDFILGGVACEVWAPPHPTLWFRIAGGHVHAYGRFMSEPAKTWKESRSHHMVERNDALAKLSKQPCLSERERDAASGAKAIERDYCCCSGGKGMDAEGQGMAKDVCLQDGGTCAAKVTEKCEQEITDWRKTDAR